MNLKDTQLKNWLDNYAKKISLIEKKENNVLKEEIIAVLTCRDLIHAILSERKYESTEYIASLIELDKRLRRQKAKLITEKIDLHELRRSFLPNQEAWWWFPEEFLEFPPKINFWNKYDRLWNLISITLFIISLCILFDINSRITTNGTDSYGAALIIIQGLLTSLFAGIILTREARELISNLLKSLGIPIQFHQEVQLVSAGLLLGAVIILKYSLPQISEHYYSIGLQNYYKIYRPEIALTNTQKAIRINPDHLEAYFLRGLLYEDIDEIKKSIKDYKIASRRGLIKASNNLARLYILNNDYSKAANLLTPLISKIDKLNLDNNSKYSLLKNLGWTRFEQNRYDEAESFLKEAIMNNKERAPAHCLLAQILESKKEKTKALKEWYMCMIYSRTTTPSRIITPEEDNWTNLASKKLKEFYFKQ